LKAWSTKHLQLGGWYLDLLIAQVLEEEKELYESCKHEEENSVEGMPSRELDAMEKISRASKSILVNLVLTANKGKKQLKPHPYAQESASNFIHLALRMEPNQTIL
jgi:hypothetical protein